KAEHIDLLEDFGYDITVVDTAPEETSEQEHIHICEERVITEADCETEGSAVMVCTECGEEVETVIIPAPGHELMNVERRAPDCINEGCEAHAECSRCGICFMDETGSQLVEPEELRLDVPEHTYMVIPAISPDYYHPGRTEGEVCAVCGEVLVQSEEIPALIPGGDVTGNAYPAGETEHSPVLIPGRDADCTHNGLTDGVFCSYCGATLEAQEVISAEKHEYTFEIITEPTCTETGEGRYICSSCSKTINVTIKATGHTELRESGCEPTCMNEGTTELVTCSVCGITLQEQETIPKTMHDPVISEGTEPTCTESGISDSIYCSICGETLLEEKELPPAGHKEQKIPSALSSCSFPGHTSGTECSECKEILTETEVIPATGHTVIGDAAHASSCSYYGYTRGNHCSLCTAVIVPQQRLDKHPNRETDPGYPAGCESEGLTDEIRCADCGEIITPKEVIPAKGHVYVHGTCSECGTSMGKFRLFTAENKWYYCDDNGPLTEWTGFVYGEINNEWDLWYVVNGYADLTKDEAVKASVNDDYTWWYVKNGHLCRETTVAQNANGWWYMNEGRIDKGYTGFASNVNGIWYCVKGKVNFTANSIIKGTVNGETAWWYVKNGKVIPTYTGFGSNANGVFYCRNGKVDFTVSSLIKGKVDGETAWWYVKNGKVNPEYSGFGSNENGVFYCRSGKVDFTVNGIIKGAINGKTAWYYVKNGKYNKAVGLTQRADGAGGWYYVVNGIFDNTAVGIVRKADGTGGWYYVVNGKYNNKATGLARKADGSSSKWYYVKNGKYTKYTGIAVKADNSSTIRYYVQNGAFTKFTGTVVSEGIRYNVVNGVVK
ncbi:MAG: hypothetical protein HUJ76_10035, partial [Parasporobacterium sp.]|nr:hypothetical protein [Parasporobacterium sp.]